MQDISKSFLDMADANSLLVVSSGRSGNLLSRVFFICVFCLFSANVSLS